MPSHADYLRPDTFTWLTIIIRFNIFIIGFAIFLAHVRNTTSHNFINEQIHGNV